MFFLFLYAENRAGSKELTVVRLPSLLVFKN